MLSTVTILGQDYTVTKTTEEDDGGNIHDVILVQNGDTIYRFSPNASDAEIQNEVNNINNGGQ